MQKQKEDFPHGFENGKITYIISFSTLSFERNSLGNVFTCKQVNEDIDIEQYVAYK